MPKLRSLIIFAILFPLPFVSQAQIQNIFKDIDEIGIFAGPSLVSIRGSSSLEEGKQTKIGYSIGINAGWIFKERFFLTTKLSFDRKGITNILDVQYFDQTTQQMEKGEVTYQLNFDYLSLPVTMGYYINKKKSLYVEAGLYVSYLLKCQSVIDYSWQPAKDYSDMKDRYYDFDGGISLLVGYKLHVKEKTSIGFWVGTNYGLFDVGRQQMNPIADVVNHETLSIGISLSKMRSVKSKL